MRCVREKKHHQSDGRRSARCSGGHGAELEPAALRQPKGSPFTGTAQLLEPSGPESARRGVPGRASISGALQPLKRGLRRRGWYGSVPNWCLTRFYEAPGTFDKSSFFQWVFKTDPKLLSDIAEVGLTSSSLNTGTAPTNRPPVLHCEEIGLAVTYSCFFPLPSIHSLLKEPSPPLANSCRKPFLQMDMCNKSL